MLIYCLSSERPENVPIMQKHFGADPVGWVVPEGQKAAYVSAGAFLCHEISGPAFNELPKARNWALEHAFSRGEPCLQVDDDLQKFMDAEGKLSNWETAKEKLLSGLKEVPEAKIVGFPTTTNAYWLGDEIKTWVNINQFYWILPSEPRFDESLGAGCHEDIEFVAQHLRKYGAVARIHDAMILCDHDTNEGGCQTIRTTEMRRELAHRVVERHPDILRMHSKRDDRVAIKARRKKKLK